MGRKMKGSKGGKFVNPTDQARKEARKRELRKNKKQRLLVRTAVLKGKDPFQIIAELERLDRMEFDYSQSSALSEKVLGDKRRKLKETWDRLVRHYIKEDKERFLELKRMESEYEARRTEMMKEYQAVKSAQEVSIEDIPLPSLPMESPSSEPATDSIIKQSSLKQVSKVPPGCPQGLPPTLGEFDGTEDDVEETDDEQESGSHKRVHFSSEDALKSDKDSNLTDFLNEIEKIERLSGEKIGNDHDNGTGTEAPDQSLELPPDAIAAAASGQLSLGKALILPENSRLPLQPAPPVASVPPMNLQPIFPPASVRPSTLPKFGGAPRLSVPQLGHGLPHMIPPLRPNAINANVRGTSNATSKSYTFLPSNSTSPFTKNSEDRKPQGTTISAKPQLRNLSADSTRFMPLSLRLKRDERPGVTSKRTPQSLVGYGMISHTSSTSGTSSSSLNTKDQKNSKDDAYVDFMKEMSGFM